jgi:hypothetical protein
MIQSSLFEFETLNEHESLDKFIQDNNHLRINYDDFVVRFSNNRHVHNHTLENLYLYFDLSKFQKSNKVVFFKKCILFINARRYKLFVYDFTDFLSAMNFDALIQCEQLKSKFLIYSSIQLQKSEFLSETKYKECVYNLNDIFNPETYQEKYKGMPSKKIRKKIYNRIKYPFVYLDTDKFSYANITQENVQDADAIHSKWVKYKLEDEKTFQIMFSAKRYMFCVNEVLNNEMLKDSKFYSRIFYWEKKPVAVRLCLLKDDKSYDIAFFSTFFECPSNLILYINAFCLYELKNSFQISTHNCGMELNKLLKTSKEHFPSTHLIGYKYNFKK